MSSPPAAPVAFDHADGDRRGRRPVRSASDPVHAVSDLTFTVEPGPGHRLPRAERCREDHHACGCCSAWPPPTRGTATIGGRTVRGPHAAGAAHRGRPGGLLVPSRAHRARPPAGLRPADRGRGRAMRRGPGHSRPVGGRGPAHRRVLDGDASAAGAGHNTAGGPPGAAARRARQRPRSGGDRLAPAVPALPGRAGPDGAGLQPRALRGRADRRRRRDHRPRPAGARLLARRSWRRLARPAVRISSPGRVRVSRRWSPSRAGGRPPASTAPRRPSSSTGTARRSARWRSHVGCRCTSWRRPGPASRPCSCS